MTNLTGSEKQIKWAEKIREQLLADNSDAAMKDAIENDTHEDPIDYPEDVNMEAFKSFQNKIKTCAESAWFIKVKNTIPYDFEDIDDYDYENLMSNYY